MSEDEVLGEYYDILQKVIKGINTLRSLSENSTAVHPQSLIALGLQSSTIIWRGYLQKAVKELFNWMKIYKDTLLDDWVSPQDEETFLRNLNFYDILKSEESLEALCDSVIQKGDQWVCVPPQKT